MPKLLIIELTEKPNSKDTFNVKIKLKHDLRFEDVTVYSLIIIFY